MEFIAIRENMGRERIRSEVLRQQHAGEGFGARLPENITLSSSVMKWPPGAPSSRPISTTRSLSR